MPTSFSPRLSDMVRSKGCGVVNIDPVIERVPASVREKSVNDLVAIQSFCEGILDAVCEYVGIVKFNIAYFEVFGAEGVAVYDRLIQVARKRGLMIIGDVKRGDIGHTAKQYALAHLGSDRSPDAITINGYFGWDGVEPFADAAVENNRGIFVLVRTSNPSASTIQDLSLSDGLKVHEKMAALVTDWNRTLEPGNGTLGPIGAVVGTRDPEDAARLRRDLPNSWLLVPGYGAQGGTAADFAPYVRPDRLGALIAAGRSVIFAHESANATSDWREAIARACAEFAADVRQI